MCLLEDDVVDFLRQIAAFECSQFAIRRSGRRVGVLAGQIRELCISLARAVHQALGFLLRRGHFLRASVADRNQNFAQLNHLLAHELRLVLVVILLDFGLRDVPRCDKPLR